VKASEGELVLTPADSGPGLEAAVPPEAALLRRAKAGDAEAFGELVLRHERLVLMTATRLLGRRDLAQDAAQDTFLRLHKYLGRFDEIRALKPWLYRVVVNVCRDVQRRARGGPLSLEELQARGAVPQAALASDPQRDAIANEERRMLAEALQQLPEKERAALVLRDIEGLTTTEVADVLESSETTVRSQISRGRLRLKALVEARLKKP
jgi:RNA polymerase sigma-70 factor (ECF subfamily)